MITIKKSVKIFLLNYLDILSLCLRPAHTLVRLSRTGTSSPPTCHSFHSQFMEDLKEAKVIRKKALLKLECKKPRLTQIYLYYHPVLSYNPMFLAKQYIIDSQMYYCPCTVSERSTSSQRRIQPLLSGLRSTRLPCAAGSTPQFWTRLSSAVYLPRASWLTSPGWTY